MRMGYNTLIPLSSRLTILDLDLLLDESLILDAPWFVGSRGHCVAGVSWWVGMLQGFVYHIGDDAVHLTLALAGQNQSFDGIDIAIGILDGGVFRIRGGQFPALANLEAVHPSGKEIQSDITTIQGRSEIILTRI